MATVTIPFNGYKLLTNSAGEKFFVGHFDTLPSISTDLYQQYLVMPPGAIRPLVLTYNTGGDYASAIKACNATPLDTSNISVYRNVYWQISSKFLSDDYKFRFFNGYTASYPINAGGMTYDFLGNSFNAKYLPNVAEYTSNHWSLESGENTTKYTYAITDNGNNFDRYWLTADCIPFTFYSGNHLYMGYFRVQAVTTDKSSENYGSFYCIDYQASTSTLYLLDDGTMMTLPEAIFGDYNPSPSSGGDTPTWSGNTSTSPSHGANGKGTLPDGTATDNAGTDENYGGSIPSDGSEPDARKQGLQIGKPENARENLYDGEMSTESFDPTRHFDLLKQVGGINMYYLNTSQIKNFYEDLWNEWDALKKLFDDPMKSIINLSQIPFAPSTLGGEVSIVTGNSTMTTAKGYVVDRFQRAEIFTGEYIDGFFNDFNDYSPKSSLSVYLPYSGWHELDIDKYISVTAKEYAAEVGNGGKENRMQRRKISLYLDLDYSVGIGKYIFYGELDSGKRMVLDTFTCQFSNGVPMTAEDYSNKISGILGIIGTTAGAVAGIAAATSTAGASAALMGGITGSTKYAMSAGKNNYVVQGSAQGSEGWLSPMDEVVFLLSHNKPYVSDNFYDYTGRPDGEVIYGNALGGFVKIQQSYLKTTATEAEINEINTLLANGCYFPH